MYPRESQANESMRTKHCLASHWSPESGPDGPVISPSLQVWRKDNIAISHFKPDLLGGTYGNGPSEISELARALSRPSDVCEILTALTKDRDPPHETIRDQKPVVTEQSQIPNFSELIPRIQSMAADYEVRGGPHRNFL